MNILGKHLISGIAILFLLAGCQSKLPQALIRTELGDITVELYPDQAPITAANFLRYVDEGHFADALFYRTVHMDNQPVNPVKIEVIQGGLAVDTTFYPPIAHETTAETGLKHLAGTISMARLEPGTASSEFFICINDQPELDFGGRRNPDGQGFAAFGRVTKGMDVVRQIQIQPADGQWLEPPVTIANITRVK
jgi:peptidyl-prolyl cis-trans isomerase A (cyclophilin A)